MEITKLIFYDLIKMKKPPSLHQQHLVWHLIKSLIYNSKQQQQQKEMTMSIRKKIIIISTFQNIKFSKKIIFPSAIISKIDNDSFGP